MNWLEALLIVVWVALAIFLAGLRRRGKLEVRSSNGEPKSGEARDPKFDVRSGTLEARSEIQG